MTLSCRVAASKRVFGGQAVSYGPDYRTIQETTLAVVPAGYADGIPRLAGNSAHVTVNGSRHRIAGRVCMDQFVLDVGNSDVRAGDDAVLFGPGTRGETLLRDWAGECGTIPNEVLVRLGPNIERRYIDESGGGQPSI